MWVPGVMVVERSTMLALAGLPGTTATMPALAPSSRKATVPVGSVAPGLVAVMVADTDNELPPAGVVVAGVIVMVVGLLGTVTAIDAAVEEA